MILKSKTFTVENDVEYQTLVESLKDELKKINTVEVHFSLDFRFRKVDDNADLYNTRVRDKKTPIKIGNLANILYLYK